MASSDGNDEVLTGYESTSKWEEALVGHSNVQQQGLQWPCVYADDGHRKQHGGNCSKPLRRSAHGLGLGLVSLREQLALGGGSESQKSNKKEHCSECKGPLERWGDQKKLNA